MSLSARIPWPAKIALKVLLSRLPLPYASWRTLGIFRHGSMLRPEYAFNVFNGHFSRSAGADQRETPMVALEIGPGDTLFAAIVAKTAGIAETYFVDSAPYASRDVRRYYEMRDFLLDRGLPCVLPEKVESFEALLESLNAHYLTAGLASLKTLPDASIDFIWSHTVLQHIRRNEFESTMRELYRILRPGGACSHCVDLQDMVGGALNNLRFSEETWESDFVATSGFYTNRIRYSEMLDIFKRAGFSCEVVSVQNWDAPPTPPHKMAAPFNALPADELRIMGFDVVLRRANDKPGPPSQAV